MLTPAYRLLALAVRISFPGGGVLLVTVGSTAASKNIGFNRARRASSVSPRSSGRCAPFACAARAAAANASGVHLSTNFCAVRLLYGPVFNQNSFVYR